MIEERDFAEDVLEGDALGAFFEHVAEGGEMGFAEGLVEADIELHSGALELVGDEVLHVAACVFDVVFFKVFGS